METLISIAINVALSIGFVVLAFHGQSEVSMTGRHGIVVDMAPQTFMVVLMSFLVPALLTRRRLTQGALIWRNSVATKSGFNAFFWALPAAVIGTCLVVGLSWLVLPKLWPTGVAFRSLLLAKAVFGGALAAFITPWAIKKALYDC
ncbi:MAG: hypothetical protein WBQ21_06710 [Solirubrobacteraceae bacterium]